MTDYGATATIDRKGRVVLPPSLVMEDRVDPDNPNRTVRGAHRVDTVAAIFGANRKSWDAQNRHRYWAAELFRDDYEIGDQGGNPRMDDAGPRTARSGPSCYGPPDVRIDAIGRYRAACEALPLVSRVVVRQVVLDGMPLRKAVAWAGRRHSAVRHSLMVGLDALVVHYEGCGR